MTRNVAETACLTAVAVELSIGRKVGSMHDTAVDYQNVATIKLRVPELFGAKFVGNTLRVKLDIAIKPVAFPTRWLDLLAIALQYQFEARAYLVDAVVVGDPQVDVFKAHKTEIGVKWHRNGAIDIG